MEQEQEQEHILYYSSFPLFPVLLLLCVSLLFFISRCLALCALPAHMFCMSLFLVEVVPRSSTYYSL